MRLLAALVTVVWMAGCGDDVYPAAMLADAGPPDSSWAPYCLTPDTVCRPIDGTDGQHCGPCPYLWACVEGACVHH